MTVQVVSPSAVRRFDRLTGNDIQADTSIRRLRIVQRTLRSIGADVDVTKTITQGTITDSFTAAPQLQFTVLDRDLKALNSGIFDDTVEVDLDGVTYELVQVGLTDTDTLQLTWQHKIIALLRRHKKFLAVQRGAMTRAQFIELLLREILPDFPDIVYVCPELNTIQPVAGSRRTGRSLVSKTLSTKRKTSGVKRSDFGLTSLQIRDWDGSKVTLSKAQLDNASLALETCYQLGASAKVTLAAMCACIVEPKKPFENTSVAASPRGHAGILQMQSRWPWATDVALSVQHALQDPGAAGKGGMMTLARQHPTWSPGQIAEGEQASGQGARYDMARAGAQQVIDAYTSAGGFAATGATALPGVLAATQQYEFTRGRAGQTEDSYTCALRLAAEVQWRFFVAGARTVYFCTDDDLLKAPTKYLFAQGTRGLLKPTFQVEKGGRTIVIHRHRVPKPSEGQVDVRVQRWEAVVGDPIEIDEYGPANGRWLIKEVDRDLFDSAGTILFQAPQKALAEPAATTSTNTQPVPPGSSSLSGDVIDRVYAACQAMSARNLPYGPAGHTGSWLTAARAPSQDCSSSVSLVLYAGGLMAGYPGPIVSGDFATWGAAGRGREMTVWYLPGVGPQGHVFIEFYGRPAKRFDTVSGGSGLDDGPRMRYTAPGSALDLYETIGFIPRHAVGH